MMFTDEQMFQLIKQLDDLKEKNVTTFEDVRKSIEFLLERQKGKEVEKPFRSTLIIDGLIGYCPGCGTGVGTNPKVPGNYCKQCGQKLIWPAYDEVKCDA